MPPTPSAPRIAIVADWLQDYAGAERVLEQLLNNFEEMSEHYDTVFESLRRES